MKLYEGQPIRTRIADAVVERLRGLTLEQGGYLKAIEQSPIALEKVDQPSFQNLMSELAGRAPAAIVVLDDEGHFEPGGHAKTQWRRELTLLVYALSTNRAGLIEGREDPGADSADPGLRGINQDIGALLAGHMLGIDGVQLIEPVGLRGLWADARLTVWEWAFRLKYVLRSERPHPAAATSVTVHNNSASGPEGSLASEDLP